MKSWANGGSMLIHLDWFGQAWKRKRKNKEIFNRQIQRNSVHEFHHEEFFVFHYV